MALRRKSSRNWARGVFATFWILLAGASGVYLFSAFTDPTLGGQLVKFIPASSETTAAVSSGGSPDQELAEIKATLRELTQQVATLTARLDPDAAAETVPSSPPAESEASSPEPEAVESAEAPEPEVAATPDAPADMPAAETSSTPTETPAAPEAAQSETQPIEQAAADTAPTPPAAPEASPEPKPYEPPPVVVAPLPPIEEEPAAPEDASAQAPSSAPATEPEVPAEDAPEPTPEVTESAALDPITLPPAANDGSTRYGIEIGSVALQDGLRPLWREFLTNHAALVAGLQPRRVLAPDKKWRLIAGPFSSAAEAAQACALFKKASRPCEATVYAGDAL